MLTAIRERATGWIAWAIVILITIPFALWGINSYFEGGGELSVATVNGEDISVYEYQEQLSTQRQLLSNRLGGNIDPALLDSLGIKRQVVDGLVDNQILREYAHQSNFRISDGQLKNLIQTVPAFQQDGQFSPTLYNEVLAANRLTPQGFEQSQRVSGILNQLENGIGNSAFVTPMELDRLLLIMSEKRKVKYAAIEADRFVDNFEVTDAEILDYYESNKDRFQNPTTIKVDYIELSIDALSEIVTPSEDDIQSHFEETRGRYKTAESRKASHILIAASESLSDEEKQEKFNKAEEVYQRAMGGEDFAELALEFSDDPGSSINGGDLGVVARGQMVKPFEDAVFTMNEGDISDPVETQFGYHVIKLTSVEEGREQSLEEVREQVAADVKKLQAEDLFAELAESFRNMVFESPDSLHVTADELGLPVRTSNWFTENEGDGVAEERQVRQAAFSEDVLNENLVSQAIEIGFDKLIAVQKSDYKEAHAKPLAEVNEEIIAAIRLEKSQALALQTGSDLLSELEAQVISSEHWSKVISENDLEIKNLPETRQEISDDLHLLGERIFSMGAPQSDQVKIGGLALENGDYVLFSLEEIVAGDLAQIDEAEKSLVEQQLLARDGQEYYNHLRSSLRQSAEIVIHEDQL